MAQAEASHTDPAMSYASAAHRVWIATVRAHRRDATTTWTRTNPIHTARLGLEAAHPLDATITAAVHPRHHDIATENQEEGTATEEDLDRRRRGEKICQETICLGETPSAMTETTVTRETTGMTEKEHTLELPAARRFLATETVVRFR